MFIKLTKMDGSPVWLNAGFIVTIEPRRGGGSTVVPVGDGFDYDVKESPAGVLEMMGETVRAAAPVAEEPPSSSESAPVVAAEAPAEPPAEKPAKPAKRARRTKASSAKGGKEAETPAAPAAEPVALTEDAVERLRKLAPRTVRKLTNTLATQFGVADAAGAIETLVSGGVVLVENERVVWTREEE
jgi:uncharacterized protein YlzI (FlbEa/FlbD family)